MVRHAGHEAGLERELQRSHRFTVGVLVSILLVSLLGSGFLILVSEPRIGGYVELGREARDLHDSMLDQETGLRGWLATGRPEFLEPYRDGTTAGRQAARTLRHNLDQHPEVLPAVRASLDARHDWLVWADAVAHRPLTARQRTDGTLERLLQTDNRLFGAYRSVDARAVSMILGLRDRAMTQQTTSLILVLAADLAMVLVAGVLTALRRRRLRRTLLEPIAGLHETIASLQAGDLTARAQPTSVPELGEIGDELGRLAEHLARSAQETEVRERGLALDAERFETLVRVGREISGSLSERYVAETVTLAAEDLVGAPTLLWFPTEDGSFKVMDSVVAATGIAALATPAFIATAAESATPASNSYARACPMVLAGRVIAVLQVFDTRVDPAVEEVLSALLSTAAAALESARLQKALRDQAEHDVLTQLFNRRRFEADIDAEWDRCHRYGRPLSLVILDLDHFKKINDQHGHPVGDEALRAAAHAIQGALRSTDWGYRYGGEEFVVILPETGLEDAEQAANRIREAVAGVVVESQPTLTLSASAGVATRMAGTSHHTALLAAADQALYDAKRRGRDQVVTAGSDKHGSLAG